MNKLTSDFTQNLLKTCQNHQLIREDGKHLNLFNRLTDFFYQKHNYDHFKGACEKLAEKSVQLTLSQLTQEQQLVILDYFISIQKKLTNPRIKQQCQTHLSILNKESIYQERSQSTKETTPISIKKSRLTNFFHALMTKLRAFTSKQSKTVRLNPRPIISPKEISSDDVLSTIKKNEPKLPSIKNLNMTKAYSDHQIKLHDSIRSIPFDSHLFDLKTETVNQIAIGQVIQSAAIPFYKELMPRHPTRRDHVNNKRIDCTKISENNYTTHANNVKHKTTTARSFHNSMHCVRVALWTQVLSKFYVVLGQEKVSHPILLATAGAYHDIARESEGTDYWDEESSEALQTLLDRTQLEPSQTTPYVKAIKEKDPANRGFSCPVQRIVHDADCLDIMRIYSKDWFRREELCFYHFNLDQKSYCDQLIDEIGGFITMTNTNEICCRFEHNSQDFYGDLVRLLFKNHNKYPIITKLLQDDMAEILKTPSTLS